MKPATQIEMLDHEFSAYREFKRRLKLAAIELVKFDVQAGRHGRSAEFFAIAEISRYKGRCGHCFSLY